MSTGAILKLPPSIERGSCHELARPAPLSQRPLFPSITPLHSEGELGWLMPGFAQGRATCRTVGRNPFIAPAAFQHPRRVLDESEAAQYSNCALQVAYPRALKDARPAAAARFRHPPSGDLTAQSARAALVS